MIIYKITNLINGKIYIGQTVQSLKKRWNQHCCSKRAAKSLLNMAIVKYGRENFEIKEIGGANSLTELNYQEWLLIHLNKCKTPNGYNINNGGGGTGHLKEDIKDKIRKANIGREQSQETRKKIGKASKVMWGNFTEEQKQKIKENLDKIRPSQKGRKRSLETRKKISKASKGRKWTKKQRVNTLKAKIGLKYKNARAVKCIDTGKVYRSSREAAEDLGIRTFTNINANCSGRTKICQGYRFCYYTEDK